MLSFIKQSMHTSTIHISIQRTIHTTTIKMPIQQTLHVMNVIYVHTTNIVYNDLFANTAYIKVVIGLYNDSYI